MCTKDVPKIRPAARGRPLRVAYVGPLFMGLKGSFEVLLDRVQALRVFKRNEKPLRVKVL